MHDKRARPTLRVIQEDLVSDWGDPFPLRAVENGQVDQLHPLSALPHPLIERASATFGLDSESGDYKPIECSTATRLWKVRTSQWRGGVWEDPETGVFWLVVAGLSKGGHGDHSDFYKRVEREVQTSDLSHWLPTTQDQDLLKRETAARMKTEWELEIQRQTLEALQKIHSGGSERFDVHLPTAGEQRVGAVEITVSPLRDDADEEHIDVDEIVVEILPDQSFTMQNLIWTLRLRVLISLAPPEQEWDAGGGVFSNLGEPGQWTERVRSLAELVETGVLESSEPGKTSHFTHREHLSDKTIDGRAVRALCGVAFVPIQDHETMPECPKCAEIYAELPGR